MSVKKDDDEKSIEELCKPLSAKVMPKSVAWNIGGREMSETRQLVSQRNAAVHMPKKFKRKPKNG